MTLPQDIKPDWINMIRRIQSVARRQQGYAIISICVVVNQDGIPMFFNEPVVTKLEPHGNATQFLGQLISGLRRS
jgi:hypothetical protein